MEDLPVINHIKFYIGIEISDSEMQLIRVKVSEMDNREQFSGGTMVL